MNGWLWVGCMEMLCGLWWFVSWWDCLVFLCSGLCGCVWFLWVFWISLWFCWNFCCVWFLLCLDICWCICVFCWWLLIWDLGVMNWMVSLWLDCWWFLGIWDGCVYGWFCFWWLSGIVWWCCFVFWCWFLKWNIDSVDLFVICLWMWFLGFFWFCCFWVELFVFLFELVWLCVMLGWLDMWGMMCVLGVYCVF